MRVTATEPLKNTHNSLLEATMSILGEMIFDHFLNASVQLVLCSLEELLRGGAPSLYGGDYETFLDNEREIVWKFPTHGPREMDSKRQIQHCHASLRVCLFHDLLSINGSADAF